MLKKLKLSTLDKKKLNLILRRMKNKRILVIGELMADEFIIGDVTRINPEAPVPVVHVNDEYIMLGGAGNVIANINALDGFPITATVIGKDDGGREIINMLRELNVPTRNIIMDND